MNFFFVPHELILCVYEDWTWQLLYIHNVGMDTFVPHELILCLYEG